MSLSKNQFRDLDLPTAAKEEAKKLSFDLQGYQIKVAQSEQTRPARLVRIGAIQNAIQKPTTAPVEEQVNTRRSLFGIVHCLSHRETRSINASIKYWPSLTNAK